jgi:hypothetical protein
MRIVLRDGRLIQPSIGAILDRRVVDKDVRPAQQCRERGPPRGRPRIGDNAARAGREIGKQRADAVGTRQKRRLTAQRRARRGLDQDGIGTQCREQPPGISRRNAGCIHDHSQIREESRHR